MQLEPFGARREDQRIGTLIATMINLKKKKSAKRLTWADIFPEPRTRAKSADELLELAVELNAALGGLDLRQKANTDE